MTASEWKSLSVHDQAAQMIGDRAMPYHYWEGARYWFAVAKGDRRVIYPTYPQGSAESLAARQGCDDARAYSTTMTLGMTIEEYLDRNDRISR